MLLSAQLVWGRCPRGPHHVLHNGGHDRQNIVGRLNDVHRSTVHAPTGVQRIIVGSVDGDDTGGRGHAAGIGRAFEHYHHYFLAAVRHGYTAGVEGRLVVYRARAARAVALAHDIYLVALVDEGAAIHFEADPRVLVVLWAVVQNWVISVFHPIHKF